MDVFSSFREFLALFVFLGVLRESAESEGNQQVITVPSGRVTRRVGEDLNLTCKIASDKTFLMMWMMPQDPELQVHRIKKEDRLNEQSVTIYHLEEADTGVYTCVAQHRDTVFKKRVFVSVSVQPVSPGRKLPCFEHSFVCGNGLCIPRRYTCDGRMDCPDGSDEAPGTCGTDPCEDKVLCEDGRCLPRATCCDPATQLGCRLTYMLPCCRKYLASVANASVGIVLVPHQHFGPGVEYLQSSVYTVVSCAVVFILVATVMVAAICRIHMRRSVMATAFRPPRCLPWCRQLHPPATAVGFPGGPASPPAAALPAPVRERPRPAHGDVRPRQLRGGLVQHGGPGGGQGALLPAPAAPAAQVLAPGRGAAAPLPQHRRPLGQAGPTSAGRGTAVVWGGFARVDPARGRRGGVLAPVLRGSELAAAGR
uniref:Putative very low density lipoprotein receptor n=1 Tax=Ixodes ricinus TaxID=34613 RepID=A0A147BHA8_IXORI